MAQRARRAALLCGLLATLAACSNLHFPGVHRIIVQQGNVVTRTMIEKLKPGMSKNQVRYVMGNSVLENPFDHDRWDYIYTADLRGLDYVEKRLSLYFENDRLVRMEGSYLPEASATGSGSAPPKDPSISRVMEQQKEDTVAGEEAAQERKDKAEAEGH